ncbi:hypothetical protein ACVMAJ_000153 [Bradyrhizobium sp. USDA 4448]
MCNLYGIHQVAMLALSCDVPSPLTVLTTAAFSTPSALWPV